MIQIFNGRTRGIGGAAPHIFMQVDVTLREHLHVFRNNKDSNALAVFMAIALHADADGWAFPDTERLMQCCGYERRETISRALEHLRAIRINGKRILAHYRVRRANGTWGRSYYLIFPDAGVERYPALADGERLEEVDDTSADTSKQPSSEKPCTAEPYMAEADMTLYIEGEPGMEPEPGIQRVYKTRCSAQRAKLLDSSEEQSPKRASKTPYSRAQLSALIEHIAARVFEAPASICAPQIAKLLHGDKGGKYVGLLRYETERHGTPPSIEALCGLIDQFVAWWRANHVRHGTPLSLPRGAAFLTHWHTWRARATNGASVCQLCRGSRLAFAVPKDISADGTRLWQIGGRELSEMADARTIVCPCCDEQPKAYEYVVGRLHALAL